MTVTVSVDTGHERELPTLVRALLSPALAGYGRK